MIKSVKTLLMVGMSSLIIAGVAAMPVLARAWEPKGAISTKVQNITSNSILADANEEGQAIIARPGDALKYTVEVSNTAEDGGADGNDMVDVKVSVTLPAGVEMADNSGKRTFEEDLGTIKPGQKTVKEYSVKVIASQNGIVLDASARFTGNSSANNSPQQGQDAAKVKVVVPAATPKPEAPAPTPAPAAPAAAAKTETPAVADDALPQTGPAAGLGAAAGLSALGYAGHMYSRSKRGLRTALRLTKK